jgi:cytochrome c
MSFKQRSIASGLFAVSLFIGVQAAAVAPAQAQARAQAAAAPAERGATLFRQRCGACHGVAPGARSVQGPHLAGVVGRRAGTAPGYNFSRAMQGANRTWTAANLDAYLAGPGRAVPGTRMMVSVNNPADRAAIVAYLATQTGPR